MTNWTEAGKGWSLTNVILVNTGAEAWRSLAGLWLAERGAGCRHRKPIQRTNWLITDFILTGLGAGKREEKDLKLNEKETLLESAWILGILYKILVLHEIAAVSSPNRLSSAFKQMPGSPHRWGGKTYHGNMNNMHHQCPQGEEVAWISEVCLLLLSFGYLVLSNKKMETGVWFQMQDFKGVQWVQSKDSGNGTRTRHNWDILGWCKQTEWEKQ